MGQPSPEIYTKAKESVGDIQSGPKRDILGQASGGIRTDQYPNFLAGRRTERVRCERSFQD